MSTGEVYFPRGGGITPPGTANGVLLPRGFSIVPPGIATEVLFPRGQIGLGNPIELIDPLFYYGCEDLTDEMSAADFDSATNAFFVGGGAGKKEGLITNSSKTSGFTLANTTRSATSDLEKMILSFWMKATSSTSSSAGLAFASDSGTQDWYFSIWRHAVAETWHHYLVWFDCAILGSEVALVSTDAGSFTDAITYGVTRKEVNHPQVWSNVTTTDDGISVDEICFFILENKVIQSEAAGYASLMYNSGTGEFYRDGVGWTTS